MPVIDMKKRGAIMAHKINWKQIASLLLALALTAAPCLGSAETLNRNQAMTPDEMGRVSFNGHYYKKINEAELWAGAKDACEAMGGYLLTINSAEEQAFIEEYLRGDGTAEGYYWIGLAEGQFEGDWSVWITGEPVYYRHWGTNEPDDSGSQYYGAIATGHFFDTGWDVKFGEWDDLYDGPMYYICEWGDPGATITCAEFGWHKYAVIEMALNPLQQQAYCEALGGYLCTITSQAEQDFVFSLASQYDYEFIGIGGSDNGDEGNWYWLNGEEMLYSNWNEGEPSNGNDMGQDYLQMCLYENGLWDDYYGGWDKYSDIKGAFICEWGEPMEQIDAVEFDGHHYALIELSLTPAEQRAYCEALGGYLCTINTQPEQDFISSLIAETGYGGIGIGGSDAGSEGNWYWLTGEDMIYTNWGEGEPNNGGEDEDCRGQDYMRLFEDGSWDDYYGEADGYTIDPAFICEWGDLSAVIERVLYNGHYYAIFQGPVYWEEAKDACEALGGHLLTINSSAEQVFIENILSSAEPGHYWIGLTDSYGEGNWSEWITGEPVYYQNWGEPQPDNWGDLPDDQNYGAICAGHFYNEYYNNQFGQWDDRENVPMGFICEWGVWNIHFTRAEFSGHYYAVIEAAMTPLEQQALCENIGGYLCTITSQEEQSFVYSLASQYAYGAIGIGGTDYENEGNWHWLNGERMGYTNWDLGEPNNGNGAGQGFMQMYVSGGGVWDDYYGAWDNYTDIRDAFICEWGDVINGIDEPDFILPASLRIIRDKAFAGVSATVVLLPESVISIGEYAFANCPELQQIYIPAGAAIADTAFAGVMDLTIFGEPGSPAETFAQNHGLDFVPYQP